MSVCQHMIYIYIYTYIHTDIHIPRWLRTLRMHMSSIPACAVSCFKARVYLHIDVYMLHVLSSLPAGNRDLDC